jgi:hypothetical protein
MFRSKLRERWHRLVTGLRRWIVAEGGYRWLVLAGVCVVVELGYVFVTSAGRLTKWPSYASRVDQLAEAFRAGQLHLLVEPSPLLVAAQNPLDPANSGLWYWDASLYKGHYYFYHGPVPALLLAAAKSILRISRPLGDETTTLALATLQLVAGAVLLERLARRLFDGIPILLVALAVIAFGLANPAPFILGRQEVYEAAIVGGHAFLLSGVVLAHEAIESARVARRSLVFSAGAAVAWALALGCRVSLAPALLFLAATTAVATAWSSDERWKRLAKSLVATGTPLVLGAFALLAYNKARFERWFEFGTGFQLTWLDFNLSKSFVLPNAYSYLLRPLETSCKFPFVFSSMGQNQDFAFPKWFKLPPGYSVYEQVAGALVTTPWLWLLPPTFALLGWRGWQAVRANPPLSSRAVCLLWAFMALPSAATLCMIVPFVAPTATMRYLGDASGVLLVFASLGAFATYAELRRTVYARWLAIVVIATAALASAVVGLALGIHGYYTHFKQHNPGLLEKLEQRYSTCTSAAPR